MLIHDQAAQVAAPGLVISFECHEVCDLSPDDILLKAPAETGYRLSFKNVSSTWQSEIFLKSTQCMQMDLQGT